LTVPYPVGHRKESQQKNKKKETKKGNKRKEIGSFWKSGKRTVHD
jgi:hypothetical protein